MACLRAEFKLSAINSPPSAIPKPLAASLPKHSALQKNRKMKQKFDDKKLYSLLLQDDFSLVKDFLDKYGVDSVDRDGRNFLTTAIVEHKNSFAKKLIDLGSDINQQDNSGYCPLLFAVSTKNMEMLTELLHNPKIDKTVRNKYGKNALGIALQAHPEDNDLLFLLVESGIDPFMKYINETDSPYSEMKEFESGEMTIGNNKLNIEPVVQKIEKKYKLNSQ
ncbi:ankyrin repeat domain-containing protein [Vaginella massiliensis]|uniref:ankyrin repeat domain-containing protein n=1 Tax=Vaginella massiliensis TaxID=1816680 RepID=UPI003752562D